MDVAEADGGVSGANVGEVVVGVGDVEGASVLVGVAVGVTDQGALVVVVEVAVGEGNPLGGVGDVEETIVEVLAVVEVREQLDVVDPDVGRGLDANGITVVSLDLGDDQVADDDVLLLVDVETNVLEGGTLLADDGLVGSDADLGGAGELAVNDDDQGFVSLGGGSEVGERGNSGGGTAGATGGATVGAGETNVGGIGDGGTLGNGAGINLVDGGSRAGGSEANQGGKGRGLSELHFEE